MHKEHHIINFIVYLDWHLIGAQFWQNYISEQLSFPIE